MKLSVALFAAIILFQHSHCKPTHRIMRSDDENAQSTVFDYNQFQLASTSENEEGASEVQSSVVTRDGTSTGDASSYQNLMPSQFGQLTNQIPTSFNPDQLSQCTNQINPSQYIPSNPASSASAPAGAASDPEVSVVTRDGTTPPTDGASSFQNLIPSQMPSQFGHYTNQIPSSFNPNQIGNYTNQFNPNQYIPSNPASSAPTPAPATAPSGAASDPEVSVVTRDGTTPPTNGASSFQNLIPSQMPSQFGHYTNQIPSSFNPSQIGNYTNSFNPSQYIPSNGTLSAPI